MTELDAGTPELSLLSEKLDDTMSSASITLMTQSHRPEIKLSPRPKREQMPFRSSILHKQLII